MVPDSKLQRRILLPILSGKSGEKSGGDRMAEQEERGRESSEDLHLPEGGGHCGFSASNCGGERVTSKHRLEGCHLFVNDSPGGGRNLKSACGGK